ncbi:Translation initiation factor 4B [Taphrina deformans PYCC 5710]|uniref:Translation initiation factor 4B n=1 Tax=Taphrina deformans (strain PYCC 5710 / ATCC 11124 / CBS 356.35 / IMI 108563 / JCM 9778 / NBRC 8474) TaxID=1097556 RepID=R4XDS5_TAPDE|nr:Translation initiation factor 4B [Taphrina deformans PYCC 5710]|eukprot:CCG81489.1 Translation initiation factor 4B [Taphrina deformans PYCC 5710]
MPPKKNKGAKISLAEFNESAGGGSNWADEMDDMPSAQPGFASAQPGFASQSSGYGASSGGGGGYGSERRTYESSTPRDPIFATNSRGADMERAGWTTRAEVPMPDRPPYTAHIGNLTFDASEAEISDFFSGAGAKVKGVRLMRDRETDRPRGFGYVEFEDLDSLKAALPLSGSPLAGRDVRVTVAEAPKQGFGDREPERDLDWGSARGSKGPLAPLDRPSRGYESRSGGYESRGGGSSFDRESRGGGYESARREYEPREARAPREPERDLDWGSARSRGPLPPAETSQREGGYQSRPGYGERRDSERRPYGGERRDSERRERDSGPDLDWSSRKGPLSPSAEGGASGPAERRKLSLAPRSAADGTSTPASLASPVSTRASPFGAARAVDTSAAEKKAEEKRQQLAREREAANAAREEKKKERKFDSRTDKPFDILRRTEDMSLEDDKEAQNVDAKADAELAAIEKQDHAAASSEAAPESDGWTSINKNKK